MVRTSAKPLTLDQGSGPPRRPRTRCEQARGRKGLSIATEKFSFVGIGRCPLRAWHRLPGLGGRRRLRSPPLFWYAEYDQCRPGGSPLSGLVAVKDRLQRVATAAMRSACPTGVNRPGHPVRQGLAAADPGARRDPQPRADMLDRAKGGEIRADLRGNRQCGARADGRDRGEVDARNGHRLSAHPHPEAQSSPRRPAAATTPPAQRGSVCPGP